MLNKIIKRTLFGFATGVFIGYTIFIIESLFIGDGNFHSVYPFLKAHTSSELTAVIIQYFVTALIGITFSTSSIIFELDNWSLLKQTIVHFIMTSIVMYFAGFACGWFPHNLASTLIWFGFFLVIYIIFWISFYLYYKRQTREINESLKKTKK